MPYIFLNLNTKKTFFLVFLFLIQITPLLAQNTFSGYVNDSNGLPIEGATVILNNPKLVVVTNNEGAFNIENIKLGSYTVTITHLGYKTSQDTIAFTKASTTKTYILVHDLLNLDTVIITGTFNPKTKLESSTTVSTLSTKDIKQNYPQGTAALLQNIPGTFVDASAGEVFTRIYTRGISASAEDDMGWYYVSLQEDGLPVSLVQHSYYSPDLFHRTDLTTKKVEALTGGSASITASNAPGGIYNFISHGIREKLAGEIQVGTGSQVNNNVLSRIDGTIGSPLGKDWFFNAGGHYRKDDGARETNYTFSEGGQFKFNVIKKTKRGFVKLYGKLLDDKTNRWTGVAAKNWDNPEAAFGQDFNTTSLLMPSFNVDIPDSRFLSEGKTNSFNPTQGIHAQDLAFGLDINHDLGNQFILKNNFKFSQKKANWQTSISNAIVSINNPLAYFISGASFPVGQIVFKEVTTGVEVAQIDNSGILTGNPAIYLSGSLPNDAIMGTALWYKDISADEWINQLTVEKKWEHHNFTTGITAAHASTSNFAQSSFAYVTYEPNPKLLQVTLENPGDPVLQLSDANGVSNYGGLFYQNSNIDVTQVSFFANDNWKLSNKMHLDLGIRYEHILHKGDKDRSGSAGLSGGVDGNSITAYDNGIIAPTGEKDFFNYTYNFTSYSAGFNYKINKNAAIFTRFSRGNKAPELNYYIDSFNNIPISEKGEIQKINQIEIGLKYRLKNASFTATPFWSQLKDIGSNEFFIDDMTSTIFYTPIQYNKSRTVGLEWESAYSPLNNLTFYFNGVLQNPKATEWQVYNAVNTIDISDDIITNYSGNQLPFNPKVLFNLSSAFEKDKFSTILKWQFMGKRFGNVANGFTLPAYSIFNLGGGYKINKNLSVNALITNLFNSAGLAGFYGENSFGANGNGATPEFIANNPDASFIVVPVLPIRGMLTLSYSF